MEDSPCWDGPQTLTKRPKKVGLLFKEEKTKQNKNTSSTGSDYYNMDHQAKFLYHHGVCVVFCFSFSRVHKSCIGNWEEGHCDAEATSKYSQYEFRVF